MFTKEFLLKLFEAFSIQRWNDQIRPVEFVEMDKHGHKMIIAFVLGKYEEDRGKQVNWIKIINSGIFELLRRIILSDIKSPVYHNIKDNHPEIIKKLNNKVYDEYKDIISNADFKHEFKDYLDNKNYVDELSKEILMAAQIYSSFWEFQIIKQANPNGFEIDEIDIHLSRDVGGFKEKLAGMKNIISKQKISSFIDLCGQLRFQVRWAQVPRIPNTSVLGHMIFVAILSYLFSFNIKSCKKRKYNNFFGGLFHDLPEATTRDIISPVKRMVIGMDEAVKEVEEELVEQKIFAHFEDEWKDELKYFIQDEFSNKVILDKKPMQVSGDDINKKYNDDKYNPIDGEIIRLSDILGAYLEVYSVKQLGITPHQMSGVEEGMKKKYKNKIIAGIDAGALFDIL